MRVYLGSDHAGYELKVHLASYLPTQGFEVVDVGPNAFDPEDDYPAGWLRGEVDAGRAALAVLIAPVTVDDFVAVNLERHKLPRKSTWFTPKARGGLVLAQLS